MKNGKIKFFTRDELRRLFDTAKRRNVRNYAMLLLAYRHALRASEVCGVKMNDLDLSSGQILCQRGKGSVSNWQKLSPDEIEAIRAWLEIRRDSPSPALFISNKGGPITRQQFFRIVRRLGSEAGIDPDKCHPHSLKHSAGTHMANAGIPVQVIQHRLGHRSIKNTMVYLAIASEYVDREYEKALADGGVV